MSSSLVANSNVGARLRMQLLEIWAASGGIAFVNDVLFESGVRNVV